MSKTQGNVLDPDQMSALMGVDGVRYAVLREVPWDRDADVYVRRLHPSLQRGSRQRLRQPAQSVAEHGLALRRRRAARADGSRARRGVVAGVGRLTATPWTRSCSTTLSPRCGSSSARRTDSSTANSRGRLPSRSKAGDAEAADRLRGALADLLEACRVISLGCGAIHADGGASRPCSSLDSSSATRDDGSGGLPLDEVAAWGERARRWENWHSGNPVPACRKRDCLIVVLTKEVLQMAHGQMTHVELPADDPARARKFYEGLFGWEFGEMPEFPDYLLFSFGEIERAGGAIGKRDESVGASAAPVHRRRLDRSAAAQGHRAWRQDRRTARRRSRARAGTPCSMTQKATSSACTRTRPSPRM